jgi:acetyltransferase-like isoleucine patch superfamily enzyme
MAVLSDLFELVAQRICSINSKLYVAYLRRKGVFVGENTEFFGRVAIDVSRPCLIEIGRNCVFTTGVVVLSHGYDLAVLREKYGEFLCSTGKVIIEDNVFIGVNSIILKGVRIGRNSIIGAGSIVASDIPSNSLAAGNPCRIIMTIDKYFAKRKAEYIKEAKAYAFEIYRKTNRVPRLEDFWDEFPIFLERNGNWGKLPVKRQLGSAMEKFLKSKPIYNSFKDFLIDAGIPPEEIEK